MVERSRRATCGVATIVSPRNHRDGNRRGLAVLCLASFFLLGCEVDSIANPKLAALSVSGSSAPIYPTFRSDTFHYAVICRETDILTIQANALDQRQFVAINKSALQIATANGEVANPTPQQDISTEVTAGGRTQAYTLHCVPEDLPVINVLLSSEGASSNLLYLTPQYVENGIRQTHLIIMDNNAVPRFTRKIEGRAVDFKRHPDGRYTYALGIGRNSFGLRDSVIVVLDSNFKEIDRLSTVGLTQTDPHDVILLEDGGAILLSYNSVVRDMSAFGLSTEEIVGDSVIQEIDSARNIVMEWNSWDHIELTDCEATGFRRFPEDYAHVNSVKLTPEGDLIVSFRGYSQVIKIDRPTGEVIWYFGGSKSDYVIVGDTFGEFCGQHTASQTSPNSVILFDNGIFCFGEREDVFGQFSRAVEYRLDDAAGQANFVRDYSRDNTYQEFSSAQGSVQLLSNGNWLIGWGSGPDVAVTEIDSDGQKQFELSLMFETAVSVSYRAFRE